jgi:RHS repeat-associated protein
LRTSSLSYNVQLKIEFYDKNKVLKNSNIETINLNAGTWAKGVYQLPTIQDHTIFYVKFSIINPNTFVVYLDNWKIEEKGKVILQENHYYPYGKEIVSLGRKGSPNHEFTFSGKEDNEEFGWDRYDFGARTLGEDFPRWNAVDPLADHPKQIRTSPYAYTNNNPIRYIDPTGMIWEDTKQAERLNKSINNRIESIGKNSTKIQAQIDKGGLSDKKLAKLEGKLAENSQKVELLNQSLADIEAIGNATETYKLTGPSSSDGTHGVVKGSDGVIRIEGSNTGFHIHEIRHIGQSIEAGGVKFNKDGRLLNAATTHEQGRRNEVEAYQVQYSFDGSYPAGASSLSDINEKSLMNIKLSNGDAVYKVLADPKKDKK